ncbi:hypothetical protein YC2023_053092 [Brassica napus]
MTLPVPRRPGFFNYTRPIDPLDSDQSTMSKSVADDDAEEEQEKEERKWRNKKRKRKKPSPSIYFVYLSGVRCISPSPEKNHLLLLFFLAFFSFEIIWYLLLIEFMSSQFWVVSHGIIGCSDQYWLLLFFLRFWLMLGTASPWVGSEFCRL